MEDMRTLFKECRARGETDRKESDGRAYYFAVHARAFQKFRFYWFFKLALSMKWPQRSTVQLLRFPFSVFLMPVFWFALSIEKEIRIGDTVLVFVIAHLLLYPSSNGYNSYMDRDETSIGGVEKPLPPTRELFWITLFLDLSGLALALVVSPLCFLGFACYVVCSRAYSYRGIRLKRFPYIGYLTVVLNQGALMFYVVYTTCGSLPVGAVVWPATIASAFLIGGFYPITQVYQHEADGKDGVETLSMKLGIRGTFIFCAAMYSVAFSLLFYFYQIQGKTNDFMILQLCFLPVLYCFAQWFLKVWKDPGEANFSNTMNMNKVAALFTNLAFITLTILNQIG